VIESSFSRFKLKKKKKLSVFKWWLVNSHREHLKIYSDYGKNSLTMEETFANKGIQKKLSREGKSLAFYTTVNKVKTLNKP